MKLDNRLQIFWWVMLVLGFTYFFVYRVYDRIILGLTTNVDLIIFVTWFAMLLVPLSKKSIHSDYASSHTLKLSGMT